MKRKASQLNWGISHSILDFDSPVEDIDHNPIDVQKVARYRQDTFHRKVLAYWVIVATSIWLTSVLVIVFLQGYVCIKLSNSVMNVLLATTTLNVLGLAYIVLEGLFGKSKRISK